MDVISDMVAKVWEVRVSAGEAVEEGDELLTLESMKMEIPVRAPAGGRVVAVNVATGETVGEGDVLLVID